MEKKIWITYKIKPNLKKEGGQKITITAITATSENKSELCCVLGIVGNAIIASKATFDVPLPPEPKKPPDESSLN